MGSFFISTRYPATPLSDIYPNKSNVRLTVTLDAQLFSYFLQNVFVTPPILGDDCPSDLAYAIGEMIALEPEQVEPKLVKPLSTIITELKC